MAASWSLLLALGSYLLLARVQGQLEPSEGELNDRESARGVL